MLCAIYKSKKKEGMYLYVAKRDYFDEVPETLKMAFGTPNFVMLFNLLGEKKLVRAENQEVLKHIQEQGFYLQMPPKQESLFEQFKAEQKAKQTKNKTALKVR
ncbi:YcgL domain-containing protein [[Mannheimia] succiniciproducens]|uniref:YcgL domain-containing protein MS1047 n=1 Tax=Mannheimia succiniciproducens (strain KCTC 0769BP / MBEL55E) TaxID=221988 RepID=Y1047_MANSM|nr:YcgL domain-containing protein [[Mannheimia] succiniciproducens]Q65TQ6.2 RecName: Full=YcgL domain-containing protein MS1047 [[Mannheimia] succiniciproducens MBEL55E]